MEENGARLNRDRLASAYLLICSLVARPGPQPRSPSQIRRRAGAVQEAVIQVLAMAERPLRAREIHAAAEELAGAPLSWNTFKDCLHKNARQPGGPDIARTERFLVEPAQGVPVAFACAECSS
jgi:hypothetical protein